MHPSRGLGPAVIAPGRGVSPLAPQTDRQYRLFVQTFDDVARLAAELPEVTEGDRKSVV